MQRLQQENIEVGECLPALCCAGGAEAACSSVPGPTSSASRAISQLVGGVHQVRATWLITMHCWRQHFQRSFSCMKMTHSPLSRTPAQGPGWRFSGHPLWHQRGVARLFCNSPCNVVKYMLLRARRALPSLGERKLKGGWRGVCAQLAQAWLGGGTGMRVSDEEDDELNLLLGSSSDGDDESMGEGDDDADEDGADEDGNASPRGTKGRDTCALPAPPLASGMQHMQLAVCWPQQGLHCLVRFYAPAASSQTSS